MQHIVEYIKEQQQEKAMAFSEPEKLLNLLAKDNYMRSFFFKKESFCYKLEKRGDNYIASTSYFVGIDWLEEDSVALYVQPKMNDTETEIDYLKMIIKSFECAENIDHIEGLFKIDYDKPWINIEQKQDILSPILVVQFLYLLRKIVQKGLKKSYYQITENLASKVKGKILVAQQVKQNTVKNRFTKTFCRYHDFGIDTAENRFLKKVLSFVSLYVHQNKISLGNEQKTLKNIVSYCLPAFEKVSEFPNSHQKIYCHKNPFYKEYEQAIKIGEYILKRFSFNISNTAETKVKTPPFWVDMSKLFELYVFGKLKEIFKAPKTVSYHDTYLGGKETDIILHADGYKCVIECKYKPRYENNSIDLGDKRQLAGYVRMKSVYDKLDLDYQTIIPGVFIYSHQSCSEAISAVQLLHPENKIKEYIQFYKLGIKLPEINAGK